MMQTMPRRRKDWAAAADAKLHRKRHRAEPEQQYHAPEPEPADAADMDCRRAKAVPIVQQSLKDQLIARMHANMLGICIREPIMHDRDFSQFPVQPTKANPATPCTQDASEWLGAYCEAINEIADAWWRDTWDFGDLEEPQEIAFTTVRLRLEAMNARGPTNARASDAYVKSEMILYRLTGCFGLNLSPAELYCLQQEVEGDIASYEAALRKACLIRVEA